MKKRKLAALGLAALCTSSCTSLLIKPLDETVKYDNVYLIMGQSNASGVSPWSFLETKNKEIYDKYNVGNDKVLMSYDVYSREDKEFKPTKFGFTDTDPFFGPEIGIAEELSKVEEKSYIIKASLGGSCLQSQYINKYGIKYSLYFRFINFIKDRVQYLSSIGLNPRIKGVFWMQGETDAVLYPAEDYYYAEKLLFENLITDLRTWIYGYINFVDAYISTKSIIWTNPQIINECKQKLADENEHIYCIKTNGEDEESLDLYLKSQTGEDENDPAHYDSLSMLALGQAAAKYLIK